MLGSFLIKTLEDFFAGSKPVLSVKSFTESKHHNCKIILIEFIKYFKRISGFPIFSTDSLNTLSSLLVNLIAVFTLMQNKTVKKPIEVSQNNTTSVSHFQVNKYIDQGILTYCDSQLY